VAVIVDNKAESLKTEGGLILWEGRTVWDAPEIDSMVTFRGKENLKPGDIVTVRITHSHEFTLLGEIVNESC